MAWLDDLLKQTNESESPKRYFWWSGIATIAGVVAKNVWLVRQNGAKLYPNVYVALISSSGTKKGEPIRVCKALLNEIDCIRVISGCNSIQGLIDELSQLTTLERSKIHIKEAHGLLISGEFATFLTNDPMALDTLTDLFSTNEYDEIPWMKKLKSGKITLRNPCLSMLFASNRRMLDSQVKPKDMEGGFIARTFVVEENRPGKLNAFMYPQKDKLDIPHLAKRLKRIHEIKGEFIPTDEVRKKWTQFYEIDCGYNLVDDRTGTFKRLGEQELKVAMLISLSKKDDLVLEWEDVEEAIEKCEECAMAALDITPSNETTNGDRPNAMKLVWDAITDWRETKGAITKAQLLRKMEKYQIYTSMVDRCIDEFVKGGLVQKHVIPSKELPINQRTTICLTDEGIDKAVKKTINRFKRVN